MDRKQAVQIAEGYFANHTVDEFHITADGQAFFTKGDAELHASSLKDKAVESVTRADVKNESSDDDQAKAEAAKLKAIQKAEATLEKKREVAIGAEEVYKKAVHDLTDAPAEKKEKASKTVDETKEKFEAALKAVGEAEKVLAELKSE
jgi:regulator of protease activity HflC (stomatin/prohibitin superfamily)